MRPLGHTVLLHRVLFCCLLSLLAVQLLEGKRDSNRNKKKGRAHQCKNKRTWLLKAADLQKTPLTWKCAHGPVVSVHVTAIKGKCKGTTGHTRWNAGRCMWNQTCVLEFQSRMIDKLLPSVSDRSCLGQIPDKLEAGYTCLKKKTRVTDTLGTFKKTRKQSGVIRSHGLLPWSYRSGATYGNVTLIKPRKPPGPTRLWISVYFYSILTCDVLFLTWDDPVDPEPGMNPASVRALRQIFHNDTTFTLGEVPQVTLTFYVDFSRHRSELEGGEKGFLLCYQWLKPNARPKRGSACNRVMKPAKCKGKRGGRKRPSPSRNKNRGGRNQA